MKRIGYIDGRRLSFADDHLLRFGTGKDITMGWDGAALNILPLTNDEGAINFGDGDKQVDVKIFLGAAGAYVEFNVGDGRVNIVGAEIRFAKNAKLEFWDATAFIHANQAGSVWIQGASAEYGIYLRAPNSEIRVDNVLHFVARTLYNQLGAFWFDSDDKKFHYWDGGERTLAALEMANVFTENQKLSTDKHLEFWDATAFIYANQAGSVWIQGASAEYGVYLKAPNSEIRVDNVLHFVARTLYNQLGSLWFDSDDLKFHYWDGGEKIIDSSAA